jgi:23S rRNA pseudouridine1911/1915/1917 synthase
MRITINEEILLIDLLVREFHTASKTKVRSILKHGSVRVNKKIVTRGDILLKAGDIVEYIKDKPKDENAPYTLLYDDESILVSEKPAGMLTIGYKDQGEYSFYKDWLTYIKDRSKGKERIYIIHRLDKEVSGIILFAKDEVVQEKIKEGWSKNIKRYYALVEGRPETPKGIIRSYLAEGPKEMMVSSSNPDKGKLAVTHYETIKEYPAHTLLEVSLETGRKNQIRVHLAEIGCPIVGDRRYGSKDPFTRKIRLHAYQLSFEHPETGQWMKFETRIPRGFTNLKKENEKYK